VDVTVIRGDLGDDRGDCIIRSVSFNNMGLSGLKCAKIGAWVKASLIVLNAVVWSGPQTNGVSLRVRPNQGDDDVGEPQ